MTDKKKDKGYRTRLCSTEQLNAVATVVKQCNGTCRRCRRVTPNATVRMTLYQLSRIDSDRIQVWAFVFEIRLKIHGKELEMRRRIASIKILLIR